MSLRTARAHRRKRYSSKFMNEYMPCIGPEGGLTFCAPLVCDDRPLYSAAGTAAMSTKTVDADGTIPNYWRDGLVHDATLNTPRITDDGVLGEAATINILTYSDDYDNWSKAAVAISSDDIASPHASIKADKLTRQDTGGSRNVNKAFTATAAVHAASLWVKAGTYDKVDCGILQAGWQNVSAEIAQGPGSATISGDIVRISDLSTTEWTRVTFTTNALAAAGASYYIYPGGVSVTETGYVYVWNAQAEAQVASSSDVVTGASTVTRSLDVLEYPVSGNISKDAGTLIVAVTPVSLATGVLWSTAPDLVDFMVLVIDSNGKPLLEIESSNVDQALLTATNALAIGVTAVIAVAWQTDDVRLYVNGGDEQADTSATMPTTIDTALRFASFWNGTSPGSARMKNLLIYNRALDATSIQHILHNDYTRWLKGTGWEPAA